METLDSSNHFIPSKKIKSSTIPNLNELQHNPNLALQILKEFAAELLDDDLSFIKQLLMYTQHPMDERELANDLNYLIENKHVAAARLILESGRPLDSVSYGQAIITALNQDLPDLALELLQHKQHTVEKSELSKAHEIATEKNFEEVLQEIAKRLLLLTDLEG